MGERARSPSHSQPHARFCDRHTSRYSLRFSAVSQAGSSNLCLRLAQHQQQQRQQHPRRARPATFSLFPSANVWHEQLHDVPSLRHVHYHDPASFPRHRAAHAHLAAAPDLPLSRSRFPVIRSASIYFHHHSPPTATSIISALSCLNVCPATQLHNRRP